MSEVNWYSEPGTAGLDAGIVNALLVNLAETMRQEEVGELCCVFHALQPIRVSLVYAMAKASKQDLPDDIVKMISHSMPDSIGTYLCIVALGLPGVDWSVYPWPVEEFRELLEYRIGNPYDYNPGLQMIGEFASWAEQALAMTFAHFALKESGLLLASGQPVEMDVPREELLATHRKAFLNVFNSRLVYPEAWEGLAPKPHTPEEEARAAALINSVKGEENG